MKQRSVSPISWVLLTIVMMLSLLSFNSAFAAIDVYEFDSPQQEAQYRGLIAEFRCPKCQNQNLAGSDAPIAQDLKQKTYEMVKAGQTDAQIREYMYDRYGDFISYKPPVRPSTWILWFFPPVLLLLLIGGWVWRTKRQNVSRMSAVMDSNAINSNAINTSTDTDINTDINIGTDANTKTNRVPSNKPSVSEVVEMVEQQSDNNQSDKNQQGAHTSSTSQLSATEKQALAALLAKHDPQAGQIETDSAIQDSAQHSTPDNIRQPVQANFNTTTNQPDKEDR